MNEKYISYDEYIDLFNKLKGSIRVAMDELDLHWTDTKSERIKKIHKAFNPEIPSSINMWTEDGLIIIKPLKYSSKELEKEA